MTSQSGYRAVSWESLPCSGRLKCPRKHAKPLVLSKMDQSDVLVEKGTPSALSEGRAGTKRQHSRILRVSFPRLRGRTSKYPLGLRQISFSSIVVSILIFSFLLRLTTFCKFQWRGGGVSGGFKGRLSASNVPRRLADDGLGGGGLDGQCMRLLGSENEGTAGTGAGRGNNPRERLNDAGDDVWVRGGDWQGFVSGSRGSRPSCEGEQQVEVELRILPSGDGNENGEPREEGPASNLEGDLQQGNSSATGNNQSINDNGPYGEPPPSYEEAVGGVGTLGAYGYPWAGVIPREPPPYEHVLLEDQASALLLRYLSGDYSEGEDGALSSDSFSHDAEPYQGRGTEVLLQDDENRAINARHRIWGRQLLWLCVCSMILLAVVIPILAVIILVKIRESTNTQTLLNTTSTRTTSVSNSTT